VEIGININGDLSSEKIGEGARLSEKLGYSHIWVGESIHFSHPLPIIAAIAHATRDIKVGSGIISYLFNRSLHIKKAFETLIEAYGERFAITLAPGDMNSLREAGVDTHRPLEKLKKTVAEIRTSTLLEKTPLYVGASGPKMIETGSELADGLLLNYAHPEYVKWAIGHLKKDTYVGVYAPAILTPDSKNEKAALLASAFVAAGSNPVFQERFGLKNMVEWIRRVLKERRYDDLVEKRDFLFDRFLICGDEPAILDRIGEFEEMGVDQVILGSPFAYNLEAVKTIGRFCSAKSVHRTGAL
jgi:5,10-methylenetetrahydromethanopterin reductase